MYICIYILRVYMYIILTMYTAGPEKLNVAHYAKEQGYTTFYAGKYLNNYGMPKVGAAPCAPVRPLPQRKNSY